MGTDVRTLFFVELFPRSKYNFHEKWTSLETLRVLNSNPVQGDENGEVRESLYVHILIQVLIYLSLQTVYNFKTMHNTNFILHNCTKGKHDYFHSLLIKSALLLSYGQHMSCWVHRFTKTTSFSITWTVMIPVSPTGCVMSTRHILQQHRIL